jgi:ferredoxin
VTREVNPSASQTHRITLFPTPARDTVLQQLEQRGFRVPYQCREGYCGACRMVLIKGSITYVQEPLAWCGDSEVLACSCVVVVDATLSFKD